MTGVFSTVLDMTVKAGVVIVAILLMRLLLLKAPKKFSYMLWSVAAFRLCVPVSFQAVFSIFSLRQSEAVAPATPPAVNTPVVHTTPPSTVPTSPMVSTPTVTAPPATVPTAPMDVAPTPTLPVDTAVPQAPAINWESVLSTAFTVLWLVGLAAMVVYGIVSYVRLYRRMQNAVRLDGNVYASDRISSPFTLGFIRPKIYLPFGLTETEQTHIIAHERYHIRRLDHIAKPFAYLLLAVHWFNPLCWLAFNRMSIDMEMSCDEAILRRMSEPGSKAQYTETLLAVASANRFPAPSPLAFNDGGGAKQRIKHALNWKKPRVWVTVIACVLCLATLVACAADTVMPKTDEPKAESDTVLYYTQPFTISTISDETLAVMDVAYIYYDEKVEDTGWSLVLTPQRDVSGFQFIEVDESEVLTAGEVLYEVESLPSGNALYVSTYINDATANRGISFLDVWGQRRYYAIRFSGKDGSLSLEEFGSKRVQEKTRIIAECEAGVADAFEIDISFDGEPDLLIAQEPAASGVWFAAYVWDAAESCYRYVDDWTLANFVLDTENQRILSYNAGDMHTFYSISYWDAQTCELVREHSLSWGWRATEENGQLVETVEFAEYENGADLVAEYTLTEWEDVYALDKTDPRFAPYFAEGSLWDLDNEKWRNFALAREFDSTCHVFGPMDMSEETAASFYGTWEVKELLCFGLSWNDASEYPTGQDVIGNRLVLQKEQFSSMGLTNYPVYQAELADPDYTIANQFYDTDEFFRVYKVNLPGLEHGDTVTVIHLKESVPMSFYMVNHERLILCLEATYFELTRVGD